MKVICVSVLIITLIQLVYQESPSSIFPEDYDKYEPPTKNGEPAHIYVSLNLLDVDNINEGKMEFSVQMYMREIWKDNRFNLTNYKAGYREPHIFPDDLVAQLWVPDLVFDNTKDGKLFHLSLPNTAIKVIENGYFYKTSRYNLIVSCPMDFHFYPMDTQECFLKIATLSNPDSKVLLHWSEELYPEETGRSIELIYKIKPLKYVLKKISQHKEKEVWPDGAYTFLFGNFTFTRRMSGALFNVYVPSTLVVLLSWISFWVDTDAVPARITLGVTSLLTLTTQIFQAHSGLPPISYLTAMDIWLFGCLLSVFSVLVEFAFAYQLHLLNTKVHGKPVTTVEDLSCLEKCLTSSPANIIRGTWFDEDLAWRKTNLTSVISKLRLWAMHKIGGDKALDKICRKMFPFCFFLFSLIYWTYFLNHK